MFCVVLVFFKFHTCLLNALLTIMLRVSLFSPTQRDPSEYVRRVGRTARGALGTGTVSVLVLGRQVRLAREIMRRNTRGDPVESTPQF